MATKRVAFTLVELLVVVGIIVLLIGILLPVAAAARRSARATLCGANLHQVGLACAMYVDSWNGRIPNNSYTIGDDPTSLSPPPPVGTLGAAYAQDRGELSTCNLEWFDVVAATLGWDGKRTVAARYGAGEQDQFRQKTQYLWCPDIDQASEDPSIRATNYGICRDVSRAYNWQATPATAFEGPLDFLVYRNARIPSDVVFLAEGRFWNAHADAYDLTNKSLGNVSRYFAPTPALIRHKGLNFLFFDGHVSRQAGPPHSMGGEFGQFSTSDGANYTITAAEDLQFRRGL